MSLQILTHRSCIVSARLLRDSIAAITGRPVFVTTNAERIRRAFIRYGCGDDVKIPDTTFNSQAFIKLVSDKSAFAKLMSDNKVHSPIYYQKTLPTKFPVLIRTTLNSSGGKGIIVCPDKAAFDASWSNDYVWTPFIKTQFELRVHVINGKIVKVFKKRFVGVDAGEEADEIKEPALPIRNLDRGYHYSARELEIYPRLPALIAEIQPVLKGRFYTLDLGWDRAAKRYFVFEANSGSGLNTQTVELYGDYLAREFMGSTV